MTTTQAVPQVQTGVPGPEPSRPGSGQVLRAGAVCAVLGGVLAVVGNVAHPQPQGELRLGFVPDYAREIVGVGGQWLTAHLILITVSVLFLGFWLCLSRVLPAGKARALGLVGAAAAMADTAVHLVTLGIDGFVMEEAAYALDPANAEQLAGFTALYQLLFGLFALWQVTWGPVFVLFGAALLCARGWPRWAGWFPIVVGPGVTVLGIHDVIDEPTRATFVYGFPIFAAALSGWIIAVGILMWRRGAPAGVPAGVAPVPYPDEQRAASVIAKEAAPFAPPVAPASGPPATAPLPFARAGAVGGILFVVGLVVSIAGVPPGPTADAPIGEVVTYYRDEGTTVLRAGAAVGVAALGYLLWIAALRARLQAADPQERTLPGAIAIASGVQLAMVVLSSVCTWVLAGRLATEGDESAVLAVFVLGMKTYSALDLAAPVVFAAIGIAVLRARALPRWLGWAMVVLAVPATGLGLVGPLVADGPFAPQGPVDLTATSGFLLWVLVASVVMLRRPGLPARP